MYATDGQTDGRTKATFIAPFPTGGGVSVSSPHYQKEKELLEKVQHRFTRMTEGFSSLPYGDRLLRLGLWMLEERRNRCDLMNTYIRQMEKENSDFKPGQMEPA